ncbi:MAG: hypothetical protein LCH61_10700 [Proteobacteria bacterium]|nr:hypothetical protein [Pseudomonadota bacterium]
MVQLTREDRARVAAAIAKAESQTSGEIVCVFARQASDYRAIPVLWAAVLAFALPWPLLRLTSLDAATIHLVQLATFIVLAVLLSLLPARMALVPRFIRRNRARRAARDQFVTQELYRTANRTGCLIYVANAEHYAEVLADKGIADHVDPAVWRSAIEALTDGLTAGRAADGLVEAVEICGGVLATHCPPASVDRNELPDRLIVL